MRIAGLSTDDVNALPVTERLREARPDVVCVQRYSPGALTVFEEYLAAGWSFIVAGTVAWGSALLVSPNIGVIMPMSGINPAYVTALLDSPDGRSVILSTVTGGANPDLVSAYGEAHSGIDFTCTVIVGNLPELEARRLCETKQLKAYTPFTSPVQILAGLGVPGTLKAGEPLWLFEV